MLYNQALTIKHTSPAKGVYRERYRGFESHPLRHFFLLNSLLTRLMATIDELSLIACIWRRFVGTYRECGGKVGERVLSVFQKWSGND